MDCPYMQCVWLQNIRMKKSILTGTVYSIYRLCTVFSGKTEKVKKKNPESSEIGTEKIWSCFLTVFRIHLAQRGPNPHEISSKQGLGWSPSLHPIPTHLVILITKIPWLIWKRAWFSLDSLVAAVQQLYVHALTSA